VIRRHDGETGSVDGRDVIGGLIDQEHVVPRARQRGTREAADGTGADDGDGHAPLSITGPRERQRDALRPERNDLRPVYDGLPLVGNGLPSTGSGRVSI